VKTFFYGDLYFTAYHRIFFSDGKLVQFLQCNHFKTPPVFSVLFVPPKAL